VARLARNKGLSTTDLIANYLEPGKPYLRNQPDGACVFLTDRCCGVHVDRPLVCRLYPLGQTLTGEGKESFAHATPHPETEGEYGHDGTVEGFLTAQGVAPFLHARDRYVAVVYRLLDILDKENFVNQDTFTITAETFYDHLSRQSALAHWLDMDRVIASYDQPCQVPEQTDLPHRLALHLEIMEAWMATQTTGGNDERLF